MQHFGSSTAINDVEPNTDSALISELERILQSSHFSQSKRAQKFIRYIVEETAAGRADELKERSIGAVVFHKALDYDTGNDSSVRVAANDVRKRIAQFYQDEGAGSETMLELRPGTYVPQLRSVSVHLETNSGLHLEEMEALLWTQPHESVTPALVPLCDSEERQDSLGSPMTSEGRVRDWASLPLLRYGAILGVIVLCVGVWGRFALAKRAAASEPRSSEVVWSALDPLSPLVFCIGYHDSAAALHAVDPAETVSQMNSVSAQVPISDAIAVASLSDYMGRRGLVYRMIAANRVSLATLRRQPAVMFGGLDNPWTMKLTQKLPFRFDQALGPDGHIVKGLIVEMDAPKRVWSLDFTMKAEQWTRDYAIVSEFNSAETGKPVFIVAGIGSAGTLAATEFITNAASVAALHRDGLNGRTSNFEAVLSTNVINGEPGPPTLEAIRVW